MSSKKTLIILGIILIVTIGVFFLRKLDFGNLLYRYSYNQSQQIPKIKSCINGNDCVLVQDKWCGTILSINKNHQDEWLKQNLKEAERARKNRQTCKPTTKEYLNIGNFAAECYNSVCKAGFRGKKGVETTDCQEINNLTWEKAFSVSLSLCEECGGHWGLGPQDDGCNPSTSDFGNACNDNSRCEGLCLAVPEDTTKAILGECSQYKFVFGCNREVVNGKIQPEFCRD